MSYVLLNIQKSFNDEYTSFVNKAKRQG
uniref:Uncharacterized protein n=1 Tax=Rhizophora mucronata TaxID=61149 RepID=A0A2P2PEJ2_RHIMU